MMKMMLIVLKKKRMSFTKETTKEKLNNETEMTSETRDRRAMK